MVVVDLQDFSEKGVSVVDLAETSRQQVRTSFSNRRHITAGSCIGVILCRYCSPITQLTIYLVESAPRLVLPPEYSYTTHKEKA